MQNYPVLTTAIAIVLGSATTSLFAEPLVTDYKEATSAYEDAYVTGSFNLQDGNQEQVSYDLDLTIDYERVFSSPDRNTKLDFLAAGSRSRGGNNTDDDESNYQALGSATIDSYFQPGSDAGFWYGKGEVGVKKGQEKPFTKATIGVGYGRVVNVTPMARSIRVIQELRKRGNLNKDPQNATYQAVATVIAKENQYRSKYGGADYEQYWVADIEKALKASGTVKGGGDLGALGILKSYDVLVNERISTRKDGWLVRAGVGAVLSDYDGTSSKGALELGAEYHRPLSNTTQFSNEAIMTTTLKDGNGDYNLNNAMSLTHELTDRVDWENQWILDHHTSDQTNDVTTNTLSSTFRYYISNQLNFNTTLKFEDVDDNIANNGNDEVDKNLFMGITYRLK